MRPENHEPTPTFGVGVGSVALRSRAPLIIGLIVGLAAVAVLFTGVGIFLGLRASNVGPLKDSGIVMCETLRDWADHNVMGAGVAPAPGELDKKALAARAQFAGSRYADIRDAGIKYVDLSRQIRALDTDSEASVALATMIGPKLFENWANLSGACVAHGVTIPALPTGP
jgi:hypothetical protein